jgi:sugar (pentulose or hexulose) kinase
VEDQLILTIDVGSSSVRASLYDRTGKYVNDTEAQLPYSFKATSGDGAEIDADWLVDIIARAVDGTLSLAKDKADRIAAVATSTFWHSVLGIDREGRPTTPILTWADRRAAAAAAELRGRLDEDAVHCRTGCVLHSSYCRPSCSGSAATLRKPTPARSTGYRPVSTFTVGSLGERGWGPRWPPPPDSLTRTSRGGTRRY